VTKKKVKGLRFKIERHDDPMDIVSKDRDEWLLQEYGPESNYRLKPSHGENLADKLRNVATVIRKVNEHVAGVLNDIAVLDIIKDVFKDNNLLLITFADRINEPLGLIYYTKDTGDGLKFWITKQNININAALREACSKLRELGYTAIMQGDGILIMSGVPIKDAHDPAIVARMVGGEVVKVRNRKKVSWYGVSVDKKMFSYSYDHKGLLTVECKKGACDITTTYQLSDVNSRQIANFLQYQIKRYEKIFEPESYGLNSLVPPFRHRKHALISCGEGCVIVITPEDRAFLVTTKGQYDLCRDEGRLGLDTNKSFKTIHHVNALNFERGDIYAMFSNILRKRGYFD